MHKFWTYWWESWLQATYPVPPPPIDWWATYLMIIIMLKITDYTLALSRTVIYTIVPCHAWSLHRTWRDQPGKGKWDHHNITTMHTVHLANNWWMRISIRFPLYYCDTVPLIMWLVLICQVYQLEVKVPTKHCPHMLAANTMLMHDSMLMNSPYYSHIAITVSTWALAVCCTLASYTSGINSVQNRVKVHEAAHLRSCKYIVIY